MLEHVAQSAGCWSPVLGVVGARSPTVQSAFRPCLCYYTHHHSDAAPTGACCKDISVLNKNKHKELVVYRERSHSVPELTSWIPSPRRALRRPAFAYRRC